MPVQLLIIEGERVLSQAVIEKPSSLKRMGKLITDGVFEPVAVLEDPGRIDCDDFVDVAAAMFDAASALGAKPVRTIHVDMG